MIFSKEFISHTAKNLNAVKVKGISKAKGISKELTHVNVPCFEEKTCLLHLYVHKPILSFSKLFLVNCPFQTKQSFVRPT